MVGKRKKVFSSLLLFLSLSLSPSLLTCSGVMFFMASACAFSTDGGRLAAARCISASCAGLIFAMAACAALMASGLIIVDGSIV